MTFRATLPTVDFAYDDASDEAKRRRLLHQIEMIRVSFTEMAVRLNEGTACRLPHEQQKLFDFHPDPISPPIG